MTRTPQEAVDRLEELIDDVDGWSLVSEDDLREIRQAFLRWYVSNDVEEPVTLRLSDIGGPVVERRTIEIGPKTQIRLSALVDKASPDE